MALEFNGTSQYVNIPGSSSLDCPTAMTVTFWCYGKSDAQKPLIGKDLHPSYRCWLIRPESSTSLNSHIWTSGGTLIYGGIANSFALNEWRFYTMRAYVSGGVVYCETWMDATYKGENHANGTGLKTATSRAVEICRDEYNKWYYNGILFDVRIYNRALTANEIAEIYHKRGADRVWEGLVGWWRLDEKTSGILTPNPYDTVVPTMTSNTTPSGVASASSEYDSSWQAWKAFSFSAASWASTAADMPNVWLKYDFGSGVTKTVKCYIIQSRQSVPTCNPKDWTFEGSNNDSDWTILDTQTNITAWDTAEFFSFPILNSTAYRYYRLNISANNGYIVTHVMNLQLLEYSPVNAVIDLSGNGNHGTPYNSPVYQASPHRLRRGVIVS